MKSYTARLVITSALLLIPAAVSPGDVAWTFEDPHSLYLEAAANGFSTIETVGYDPNDPNALLGYPIPKHGNSVEHLESARLALEPTGQPTGQYGLHFYGKAGHYDPNYGGPMGGHPNALNGFSTAVETDWGNNFAAEIAALSDFGANGFTLAAYIRPEDVTGSGPDIPIMSNIDLNYFPYRGFTFGITGGKLKMELYWAPGQWISFSSNAIHLAVGQVNHVAVRLHNGSMALFIDGLEVPSSMTGGWWEQNFSPVEGETGALFVGGVRASWYPEPFTGDMDDVKIFGRALTDQEILDLAGGPKCGSFGYMPEDLNQDCYVNETDLQLFVAQFLECTDPANVSCD